MSKKKFIIIILVFITVFVISDRGIAKFLEYGLYKYYGIGENCEVALVGHSHLMLGVDKLQLEKELGVTVAKYTREGVNVFDRFIMLQKLFSKPNKIHTVIYGVDPWSFTGEGLSENSHQLFYPFLDDDNVDTYVKSKDNYKSYIAKKWIKTSRFNEQLFSAAMRGHLGRWDNLKYGLVDTLKLKKEIERGAFRKIEFNQIIISQFKKTLDFLKAKNVNIILLHVPVIDILRTAEKEKFDEVLSMFKSFEDDSLKFLNFQEPWEHQLNLFYDPIHLNPEGQGQITKELVKELKKLKY